MNVDVRGLERFEKVAGVEDLARGDHAWCPDRTSHHTLRGFETISAVTA